MYYIQKSVTKDSFPSCVFFSFYLKCLYFTPERLSFICGCASVRQKDAAPFTNICRLCHSSKEITSIVCSNEAVRTLTRTKDYPTAPGEFEPESYGSKKPGFLVLKIVTPPPVDTVGTNPTSDVWKEMK